MTGSVPHDGSPGDGRADTEARKARAAFRAFVRANHPDMGGDPEEFATGLRRFRGEPEGGAQQGTTAPEDLDRYDGPVFIVSNRRGIGGTVDRVRRWQERRKRPPRVI